MREIYHAIFDNQYNQKYYVRLNVEICNVGVFLELRFLTLQFLVQLFLLKFSVCRYLNKIFLIFLNEKFWPWVKLALCDTLTKKGA